MTEDRLKQMTDNSDIIHNTKMLTKEYLSSLRV
jgi:hypothetical protein